MYALSPKGSVLYTLATGTQTARVRFKSTELLVLLPSSMCRQRVLAREFSKNGKQELEYVIYVVPVSTRACKVV
jgi:hypothetical protein